MSYKAYLKVYWVLSLAILGNYPQYVLHHLQECQEKGFDIENMHTFFERHRQRDHQIYLPEPLASKFLCYLLERKSKLSKQFGFHDTSVTGCFTRASSC